MRQKAKYQLTRRVSMNREFFQEKPRKTLRCSRCKNHNVTSALRGHKKQCPFRCCTCSKCALVGEKQRIVAAQSALERQNQSTIRGRDLEGQPDGLCLTPKITAEISPSMISPLTNPTKEYVDAKVPTLSLFDQTFSTPQSSYVRPANPEVSAKSPPAVSSTQPFISSPFSLTQTVPQKQVHPPYVSISPQRLPHPDFIQGPQLMVSSHFQEGGNLRFRYLNLLSRLFSQFSDIFINSVLEDTNCDLLAAAEWLVQLEDRRSFMYPAFETFGTLPFPNQYCENPDTMHQKAVLEAQHIDARHSFKFPPPNLYMRHGRDVYGHCSKINNDIQHGQPRLPNNVCDESNLASNNCVYAPSQPFHTKTANVNKITNTLSNSQINFDAVNLKSYAGSGANGTNGWDGIGLVNRSQNNNQFAADGTGDPRKPMRATNELGPNDLKCPPTLPVVDSHVGEVKHSGSNTFSGTMPVCTSGDITRFDNYQQVNLVSYINPMPVDGREIARKLYSIIGYDRRDCGGDDKDQQLSVISEYIEEEEGFIEDEEDNVGRSVAYQGHQYKCENIDYSRALTAASMPELKRRKTGSCSDNSSRSDSETSRLDIVS